MEIFPLRVEKKYAHRVESENLRDFPHHFVQDRLDLQRLASSGGDLVKSCEVSIAVLVILEKPGVFDSDHRLIGEGFQQSDLFFRERMDLVSTDMNRTNGNSFTQQRD